MKYSELIVQVAVNTSTTKDTVKQVIDGLQDEIIKAGSEQEDVPLPKIGKFTTSFRKARAGRNPQTGESIDIAERNVPAFKASKGYKEAVK